MKYINNDIYTNVFWQYDGKPYLENNITKALINTIHSYDTNDRNIVFKMLFGIDLKDKWEVDYYLQAKPIKRIQEEIYGLDDEYKIFFGLCPSGNYRVINNVDTKNVKTIKESLEKYYDEHYLCDETIDGSHNAIEPRDAFVKREMKDIVDILNDDGGSIPDAWIIIYDENNVIKFAIIFENKLIDLNQQQIYTHIKKSLGSDPTIFRNSIYKSFNDVVSVIKERDTYLSNEFYSYMYHLGHISINCLNELKDNNEILIRRRLIQVLKNMQAKYADGIYKYQRGWCDSYVFLDKSGYLTRVGFKQHKTKGIELLFYFPTLMTKARSFYSNINEDTIKIFAKYQVGTSFHFQRIHGNNYRESYINETSNAYAQIDFWQNNIDWLHDLSNSQRKELYHKMYEAKAIIKEDYQRLSNDCLVAKMRPIPELCFYDYIDLNEAKLLDEKGELGDEIHNRIHKIITELKLK